MNEECEPDDHYMNRNALIIESIRFRMEIIDKEVQKLLEEQRQWRELMEKLIVEADDFFEAVASASSSLFSSSTCCSSSSGSSSSSQSTQR